MLFITLHQPCGARVLLQRAAGLVLLLLLAAQASAVVGETLSADQAREAVYHPERSGSGPGHGDETCDPSCPCACCPGHSVSKAISPVTPVLHFMAPRAVEAVGVVDLHPAEVTTAIFHPPRA